MQRRGLAGASNRTGEGYSRVLPGADGGEGYSRAGGGGGVLGEYSRILPRYRSGHWSARLLRHGRGAARAVRSCTGAYVSGAAGSNACPAGSVRIETEEACLTAINAAGKTVGATFVFISSAFPRGCYYTTSSNYAYFNTHAVGAGIFGYRVLCAAVTTGAPPPRREWALRRLQQHYACVCRTRTCGACAIPTALISAVARRMTRYTT